MSTVRHCVPLLMPSLHTSRVASSVQPYHQAVRGVFLESGLPLSLWPLVSCCFVPLFYHFSFLAGWIEKAKTTYLIGGGGTSA